jgi:hypothetical protein
MKLTIQDAHAAAKNKNGTCLSSEYKYGNLLRWKCNNPDHPEFELTLNQVRNTSAWCKKCFPPKYGKGEGLLREILEEILQEKLPKSRPNFLINPKTNHKLELDCYSETLKLGFEYQGAQHDNSENHIHSNSENFDEQIEHDNLKKSLCKKIFSPYHA